jgi:hypothetical protein
LCDLLRLALQRVLDRPMEDLVLMLNSRRQFILLAMQCPDPLRKGNGILEAVKGVSDWFGYVIVHRLALSMSSSHPFPLSRCWISNTLASPQLFPPGANFRQAHPRRTQPVPGPVVTVPDPPSP